MGKNSFVLYTDIWPMIQKLDKDQRGELFTAIMQYAIGEDPELDDVLTDMAFGFIKAQMDRAEAKYQDICARRAEYGRRGGIAKASKSKQKLAKLADSESEPERDSEPEPERERDSDSEALAPLPPLSRKDEDSLREAAGERADGLIEDVKRYYGAHPEKRFPGWPVALAQFDSNQKRWGTAVKRQSSTDRAFEAFKAEIEAEEKK